MKRNTEDPGQILDQAIDEVRQTPISPEQAAQASARTLQRMRDEYNKVVMHPSADASSVDRIQSCEDFRSLIPAYLTASLTPRAAGCCLKITFASAWDAARLWKRHGEVPGRLRSVVFPVE